MNAPVLTINVPASTRSLRFVLSAAGFIHTSTSGASPGVWISDDEKCSWNPETPNKLPAGARISAGKSGKVEMSLPASAAAFANSVPVSCMPSPESPAKRITTRSRCLVSIAALPRTLVDKRKVGGPYQHGDLNPRDGRHRHFGKTFASLGVL